MGKGEKTANRHRSGDKDGGAPVSTRRIWYRWILMTASITAVSWVAIINIGKLDGLDVYFRFYFISYAFLAALCAYLAMFFLWIRLASIFGLRAPVSVAGRAYFLSYLARYIPGKIGIFLMRAEIYGGRSTPGTIMATALEQVAVLAAAFIIVLLGILLTPSIFPPWLRITSVAGLAVIVFVIRPSVLNAISRTIHRVAGRKLPVAETSFTANLGLVLLYTIPCVLHGLSLFLVVKSLYPISLSYLPTVTGVYIGAILAGLFAVFIPGGLGVREGTLILALSAIVSGEVVVIAPVVIRLVTIAAEICLAAGFSLFYIWKERGKKDTGAEGRLLYIVHEYPPIIGGTGIFVSNIVAEIGLEKDIVVITASDTGRTSREKHGHTDIIRIGIPFRDRKFHNATIPSMLVFVLLASWHGWRSARKTRFSGIHAFHLFPSGAVGIILSRLLGIPCAVTAIGAEVYDPSAIKAFHSNRLYRWMIAGIMRSADRLSAISTDIAERMREYHDIGNIEILPPGIPPPPHLPEKKPHDGFRICSVSRLARRKGLDTVIRALARLEGIPVRYLIVGDGNERNNLERLSEELGVRDRIEFLGFVGEKEKYDILVGCDAFVLPSLHEGFGICYIEAMSAGLPVIAASSGGHRDFIIDGVNGILVQPGDEAELAGAISRLFHDPGLREVISAENSKKARLYHTSCLKDLYIAHFEAGRPKLVTP